MKTETEWAELCGLLPSWLEASRQQAAYGKPASYIPELAHAPADALGVTIMAPDGRKSLQASAGMHLRCRAFPKYLRCCSL